MDPTFQCRLTIVTFDLTYLSPSHHTLGSYDFVNYGTKLIQIFI
jgi:hypothetical protein